MFRQAASKRGFTEQIGDLLKEFSRYCLDHQTMSNLHDALASTGAPRTLLDKAEDLSLLLTKIEEKLGTTYVDSEGHLALLASQIHHSDLLKGADIYIDGFENFTTQGIRNRNGTDETCQSTDSCVADGRCAHRICGP